MMFYIQYIFTLKHMLQTSTTGTEWRFVIVMDLLLQEMLKKLIL